MKHPWLAALLGAVLGGGAVALYHYQFGLPIPQAGVPAGGEASLALGSPVSAQISKDSLLNPADGSRSQVFRLAAQRGQLLDVQVRGALDARLSVLRDGYLLARSEEGANWCEQTNGGLSLLKRARLVFDADRDGAYDIAVSGNSPYAFGPFEVEARLLPAPADASRDLTLEQPVEGIATGQPRDYDLAIAQAGLYAIELRSCDFDGMLTLTGAGVQESNDDQAGSYDPRLETWLEPGRYTVKVHGSGPSIRGQYRLHAAALPLPQGGTVQMGGALQPGQPLTGLLRQDADAVYHFTLADEAHVTLTLRSESFDPYLSVEGAGDGQWSDDDSGGGPRGTDARLDERLPAGDYTVRVSGYGQGLFSLGLAVAEP